jgi:hypothetical protein
MVRRSSLVWDAHWVGPTLCLVEAASVLDRRPEGLQLCLAVQTTTNCGLAVYDPVQDSCTLPLLCLLLPNWHSSWSVARLLLSLKHLLLPQRLIGLLLLRSLLLSKQRPSIHSSFAWYSQLYSLL